MNFFLTDPADEAPLSWWKHLTIGVAASFMVPLFLNMISGDLIDKIRGVAGSAPDYSKLFVLAGFCLVAAVSSRAFIRTLSERVLQQVKSANRVATEAKAVAVDAKATVGLVVEEEEISDDLRELAAPVETIDDSIIAESETTVLKAMLESQYSLRSISGISKDTGLSKQLVNRVLSSLIAQGLVSQSLSSKGQPRWFATLEGRAKKRG